MSHAYIPDNYLSLLSIRYIKTAIYNGRNTIEYDHYRRYLF